MNLCGRRIHIAGSADQETDEKRLQYVHSIISKLTAALAAEGATFVIPFGKEPLLRDRTDGPSIIFDWTVAEAVYESLTGGRVLPPGPNGPLVLTVVNAKTDDNIPARRRNIYDELRNRNSVGMESLLPGWSAGGILRRRLAQLGDVFIGISGGQGVEQLAVEYSSKGKPVIPLDIRVGSSSRDGSGGASRLFERAIAEPDNFFKVLDGYSATDLLDKTKSKDGNVKVESVVSSIMDLLHKLVPPRVFYVRLLNDALPEYLSVERFFRDTVDTLVKELGYGSYQMGIGKNEFAWMNEAIFDSLHQSAVVLVDITSLRPNCFMELGYALGNRQRVIITARDDTKIPFDAFGLETFPWKESESLDERLKRFRTHWERNINKPNLVKPKEAK